MRRRGRRGRRDWAISEEKALRDNYKTMTIKELMKLLDGRTADSINAKIKRLKARRKLEGYKDEDVKNRSLQQRRKKI